MNISESKAVFDLLDALGGVADKDDYHRKTVLAVEAVVFLAERARNCLGAGPDSGEVLGRIADAGWLATIAAATFMPIADECENVLFWRDALAESDQEVAR